MRSDKVNSSKRTIIRSDPYFIGSALNFNVAPATYSPLKNEKSELSSFFLILTKLEKRQIRLNSEKIRSSPLKQAPMADPILSGERATHRQVR